MDSGSFSGSYPSKNPSFVIYGQKYVKFGPENVVEIIKMCSLIEDNQSFSGSYPSLVIYSQKYVEFDPKTSKTCRQQLQGYVDS